MNEFLRLLLSAPLSNFFSLAFYCGKICIFVLLGELLKVLCLSKLKMNSSSSSLFKSLAFLMWFGVSFIKWMHMGTHSDTAKSEAFILQTYLGYSL